MYVWHDVYVIKNILSALQIKNTSESDPRSYGATKAVTNKAPQKIWGSNGIRTHDFRNTRAMLYQLSSEALLEAGQVQIQFIPVIWREWHDVCMKKDHMSALQIRNTSESDPRSYKVT